MKALGVLRVLAEQVDPTVRGYWDDECFVLLSRLDREALLEFFLRQWSPSPFVSPWNKGSGLLGKDAKGVGPVEGSTAARFEQLREGIRQAKALTGEMEAAVLAEKSVKDEANREKNKAKKAALRADPEYKLRLAQAARTCKALKDGLQPECQLRWRGPALQWLRTAVVLAADGKATFPSLLGTGGNDGKLDFTNNSLQRIGDLFDLGDHQGAPRAGAESALVAALYGEATQALVKGGIGQFSPAASGGANATSGALGDSYLNPWDLPLLLEGARLFTAGTSRRLRTEGSAHTVAPFSARAWSAGYGSAARSDESVRGEQWMPLWAQPWTAGEVTSLLAEGRCQLGRRSSESSMDVARAVARLGVARGVTAFERYGFIERNGKSNYAVPLGRWRVRAEPHANLLEDLEAGGWWVRLRRAAAGDRAPGSLARLERNLGDAIMACLAHPGEPPRWQEILIVLAQLEAQLVISGSYTAAARLGPIPRLSPGWIRAADDGQGAELRLALALAGAARGHDRHGRPIDGVRRHWLPLEKHGRFATGERSLVRDPGVVVHGRQPDVDLVALVQRRIVEAERGADRALPLVARRGTAVHPADVTALLAGAVDLGRALWLGRALSALEWAAFDPVQHRPLGKPTSAPVDPIWTVLRLCHLPGPLHDGTRIPVDPAIVRRLASGDGSRALALALQRLRSVGIRSPLVAASIPRELCPLMAASLAFPISTASAKSLAEALHPQSVP